MGARIIAKPNLSQALTAVILAAGHGTRMRSRTPKVLHPICGRPMVDWVLDAVDEAGAQGHQGDRQPPPRRGRRASGRPGRGRLPARAAGHRARAAADPRRGPVARRRARRQRRLAAAHRRHHPQGDRRPPQAQAPGDHRAASTTARATTAASSAPPTARSSASSSARTRRRRCAPASTSSTSASTASTAARSSEALGKITNDNKAGEFYLHRRLPAPEARDHRHASTTPTRRWASRTGLRSRAATATMRRADPRPAMMLGRRHDRRPRQHLRRRRPCASARTRSSSPSPSSRATRAIGPSCRIGPHVHIEDARIGDRSDCGPFAKLRPGTEIAEDVHIGSFAELVRTKVGRGSKVPHVSYLGDTDVGEDANIGAGTITANFDGDEQEPDRDRRRRLRRRGHDAGRARQTWQGIPHRGRFGGDQGRARRRDSRRSSS